VCVLTNILFQSFKRIAEASSEELSQCPGFGATKVKRVRDVFSQPFRVGETRSGRERRAERQRLVDNGAPPLPSSGASVGRFIDDDEEEELLRQQHDDDEAIAQPPKHPSVTESSSYVKPKTSGVASNAIADPDEEEEIENAGERARALFQCLTLLTEALCDQRRLGPRGNDRGRSYPPGPGDVTKRLTRRRRERRVEQYCNISTILLGHANTVDVENQLAIEQQRQEDLSGKVMTGVYGRSSGRQRGCDYDCESCHFFAAWWWCFACALLPSWWPQ
jgi:hypothetical protein